jgi:hypothetical protein
MKFAIVRREIFGGDGFIIKIPSDGSDLYYLEDEDNVNPDAIKEGAEIEIDGTNYYWDEWADWDAWKEIWLDKMVNPSSLDYDPGATIDYFDTLEEVIETWKS